MPNAKELIEELYRNGTVVARLDGSTHDLFPVSVSAGEGAALRELVRRERAVNTVEIGFGYGLSALFICEGLLGVGASDCRHVVIDPHQSTRFRDCGLQLIEDAGFSRMVEYHPLESEIALPRFLAEGRRFDFAFVDGNHRFEGVFLDLVYLNRLVRDGGLIVVDDFQLASVAKAVSFLRANMEFSLDTVSKEDPFHHWAAIRKPVTPPARAFDHFVDF